MQATPPSNSLATHAAAARMRAWRRRGATRHRGRGALVFAATRVRAPRVPRAPWPRHGSQCDHHASLARGRSGARVMPGRHAAWSRCVARTHLAGACRAPRGARAPQPRRAASKIIPARGGARVAETPNAVRAGGGHGRRWRPRREGKVCAHGYCHRRLPHRAQLTCALGPDALWPAETVHTFRVMFLLHKYILAGIRSAMQLVRDLRF